MLGQLTLSSPEKINDNRKIPEKMNDNRKNFDRGNLKMEFKRGFWSSVIRIAVAEKKTIQLFSVSVKSKGEKQTQQVTFHSCSPEFMVHWATPVLTEQ